MACGHGMPKIWKKLILIREEIEQDLWWKP